MNQKTDNSELVQKDNFNMQAELMKYAANKDVDPDKLEKLLELQIKMEDRQADRALSAALASFQQECPIIKKVSKVSFGQTSYSFAPFDEIVHIIKPLTGKYGLSYSFETVTNDKKVVVTATISHKDGGKKSSSIEMDSQLAGTKMNSIQAQKSVISYGKRITIENVLGIATAGEDDDAKRAIDIPISEAQKLLIEKLMKNTGTEEKTFLQYLKIDDLSDLSEYEAKKAISSLKQKRTSNV